MVAGEWEPKENNVREALSQMAPFFEFAALNATAADGITLIIDMRQLTMKYLKYFRYDLALVFSDSSTFQACGYKVRRDALRANDPSEIQEDRSSL